MVAASLFALLLVSACHAAAPCFWTHEASRWPGAMLGHEVALLSSKTLLVRRVSCPLDGIYVLAHTQVSEAPPGARVVAAASGFVVLSSRAPVSSPQLVSLRWRAFYKAPVPPAPRRRSRTRALPLDMSLYMADLAQLTSWNRRFAHTEAALAQAWLMQRMLEYTPHVSLQRVSQHSNVVAVFNPEHDVRERIVVGAHWDSTSPGGAAPGAVDNGSGAVLCLAVAHALSQSAPEVRVDVVLFAEEEVGLLGSEAYAAGLTVAPKFALIFDMVGYRPSSQSQGTVLLETYSAHEAFVQEFRAILAGSNPLLGQAVSYQPFGSDHMPFLNRGYPSLLYIDDAWNVYGNYHLSTDTADKVVEDHARQMAEGALAIIEQLSKCAKANIATLAQLLINWGEPSAWDLNNDGTVTIRDLALLLVRWGECVY